MSNQRSPKDELVTKNDSFLLDIGEGLKFFDRTNSLIDILFDVIKKDTTEFSCK